ncbi:Thioredoxin-like fold domain-containing protein [Candidatus Electrothrix aarhusensis]
MHKQAKPAALASIAAHEQGKFWQMHDALFTVSKDLSKENIEKAAKDIGLDMEKFKKDLTSPTVQAKLKKDMVDAGKAGVGGTPTLFINGRQVKGRGENVLQEMIDQELAKK